MECVNRDEAKVQFVKRIKINVVVPARLAVGTARLRQILAPGPTQTTQQVKWRRVVAAVESGEPLCKHLKLDKDAATEGDNTKTPTYPR